MNLFEANNFSIFTTDVQKSDKESHHLLKHPFTHMADTLLVLKLLNHDFSFHF